MKVVIVGAGLAGSVASLRLLMEGFDVVLVGSDDQLPWGTLIHSKLLRFEEDVVLAHESMRVYREIGEYLGDDLLFPINSLSIVRSEYGNRLRLLMDIWGNYGVKSMIVGCGELGPRCLGDEIHVLSRGGDHLVRISRILRAARSLVRFIRGRAKLIINGDEVYVEARGIKLGGYVVLCSGAWNAANLRSINIDAPLKPYKCQSVAALMRRSIDFVIYDYNLGFYSRPLHPQINNAVNRLGFSLLAVGNGNSESPQCGIDEGFLEEIREKLRRRLGSALILGHGYGFCEATPDMRPVVGKWRLSNLYLLGGLDGYGAEVGPGLVDGLVKILKGEQIPDHVKPYLVDRFLRGWPSTWSIDKEAHELQ